MDRGDRGLPGADVTPVEPGWEDRVALVPPPGARRRPLDRAAVGAAGAGRAGRRDRPGPSLRHGCPSDDPPLRRAARARGARIAARRRLRLGRALDRGRAGSGSGRSSRSTSTRLRSRRRSRTRPRTVSRSRRFVLDGEADELPRADVAVANVLLAPVERILARLDGARRDHVRAISSATCPRRPVGRVATGWSDGWAADGFEARGARLQRARPLGSRARSQAAGAGPGCAGQPLRGGRCSRVRHALHRADARKRLPSPMATFTTRFLGCKVSFADEQAIRERLLADGHTEARPAPRQTSRSSTRAASRTRRSRSRARRRPGRRARTDASTSPAAPPTSRATPFAGLPDNVTRRLPP